MNQQTQFRVTSPVLWGIIGALAVWGVYLAIGSTGYFAPNAGFFDARKPLVVVLCSAAFLAFWWGNLRLKKRRLTTAEDSPAAVNPLSWISLALGLLGYGFWAAAYQLADPMVLRAGLTAACCFGAAMLTGIIAVSDPARKKAKWAAMLGIAMALLSCVLFVVQVRMYFDRTSPL